MNKYIQAMENKASESAETAEYRLTAWENMFHHAEKIKSNMKFYSTEMSFLHHLLDRYLLWLIEEESLAGVQLLNSKVKAAEQKCTDFITKSESLMTRIGLLIENPFAQDEHRIQESFRHTKEESEAFESELKRLKAEVFDHVANTLRTEKARRLLNPSK